MINLLLHQGVMFIRSGAARHLVSALTSLARDEESLLLALGLSMKLCSEREAALQLSSAGAVRIFLSLVDPHDLNNPHLPRLLELVWTVCAESPGSTVQIADGASVERLAALLLHILSKGHRLCDKELRDDVMLIALLVAREPSAGPHLAACGLGTVFAHVSCAHEVEVREAYIKTFNLTASQEDFDLKISSIDVILSLLFSPDCAEEIAHSGAFEALAAELADEQRKAELHSAAGWKPRRPTKWTQPQVRLLRDKIISLTGVVAVRFPDLFQVAREREM